MWLNIFLTNFQSFLRVSSELKRRLKAEQKAKEKAEQKAEKDKAAVENGLVDKKASATSSAVDEENISPNEFFKLRTNAVQEWKKNPETHPYPHKFHVSLSLEEFVEKYKDIADGVRSEEVKLSVAGRVHSIRNSGAKLIFYDLRGEGVKIQVMANASLYKDEQSFADDTARIRRGDIIGIEGSPGKTKKGELSVIPTSVSARSHCVNRAIIAFL